MTKLEGLIDRLIAVSEQQRVQQQQTVQTASEQKTLADSFVSLETQIEKWWASLPAAMQQRRFHVTEIAQQCTGRYRPKPALREVASALRFLGWSQRRDWTLAGRNVRYWVKTL
jgi:hypothetical protein